MQDQQQISVDSETSQLRARIAELEAKLAASGPWVLGWQLVPKEATDDMVDVGCDAADAYRVDIANAWTAMLAAAPQPHSLPLTNEHVRVASFNPETVRLAQVALRESYGIPAVSDWHAAALAVCKAVAACV